MFTRSFIVEKNYRRTASFIAVLMIIQFCLWFAASFVYGIVGARFATSLSPVLAEVCGELVFAILYAVSFGVPILLGTHFIDGRTKLGLSPRFSLMTVPMLFSALGVIFAAAILNNLVTAPFDSIGLDVYTPDMTMTVTPMTFTARLVSLVILPALLEELLFRKVILGALLPYGKWSAVVASAFLFAMMHQNPKQFIYAFAAGAVIGYFVCETRSIWIGVLIHGVNNLISLVNMAVMNACDDKIMSAYSLSLYFAVFSLAGIALPVIIGTKSANDEQCIRGEARIKDFFCPVMIIYFVISLLYFVFMIAY